MDDNNLNTLGCNNKRELVLSHTYVHSGVGGRSSNEGRPAKTDTGLSFPLLDYLTVNREMWVNDLIALDVSQIVSRLLPSNVPVGVQKPLYAPSVRTTLYFLKNEREYFPVVVNSMLPEFIKEWGIIENTQTTIKRGDYDFFHLVKTDFILPGLGSKGVICGSPRITHFSDKLDAVKEGLLRCKRMACPSCYSDWIKHTAFNMTLAVELTAYARGQRPVNGVVSVDPKKITSKGWRWDNVNVNLFQYPYRKLKARGVLGGTSAFHPFRIRGDIKARLKSMRKRVKNGSTKGYLGDIGLWKMVRDDLLKLGSFYAYVDLSPHVHFMGVPGGDTVGYNKTKGLVIRYQVEKDPEHNNKFRPKRLRTVKDVLSKCIYLLTHTGSLTLDKEYTKATRRFGIMQGKPYKELLSKVPIEVVLRLRKEIAESLGMVINRDGALDYPDDAPSKDYVWIPLRDLRNYLATDSYGMSDHEFFIWDFFDHLMKVMKKRADSGLDFFPEASEIGDLPDGVMLISEDPGNSFSDRTEPFDDVEVSP